MGCLPQYSQPSKPLSASFQELATTESSDPDPTSLALSTLELNAYRAERAYRKTIEDYQRMAARSTIATWSMDKWDRSY